MQGPLAILTIVQEEAQLRFFQQRCIVPLFPIRSQKVRQVKVSRSSGQEASYVSMILPNDTEEEIEVEVKEMVKHEDISPFVDLEAYKGQDDRHSKSLGTPGLLIPSHYILPDGKVN